MNLKQKKKSDNNIRNQALYRLKSASREDLLIVLRALLAEQTFVILDKMSDEAKEIIAAWDEAEIILES